MKKSLLPDRADFYVQTNNERDGMNACQRTAGAQCLDIIGEVGKIPGPYKQPEDNLDWLANDKRSPFFDGIRLFAHRSNGPCGGVPYICGGTNCRRDRQRIARYGVNEISGIENQGALRFCGWV